MDQIETRVDWFEVGKEHWDGNQERIKAICSAVEWIEPPCTLGFMQGECINTCIKEFKIPKVSHVAVSHELAPFGLCGIRGHYKNADVDFFVVDEGTHISSLCAFVSEKADE